MEEERLQILKMLEMGQIDAQQAAELLAALDRPEMDVLAQEPEPMPNPLERPDMQWARFWIYPLMAGGLVLILGSLIMGLVYATAAARGWLVCGWLPMLLGLGIMFLALWSRSATWLYVRISEETGHGRNVAFGLPVPLTLAAWAMRFAQPFVPQLKDTGVDDLIIALRDSARGDEPLFIDVQDDEKGERVQLYFG